MKLIYEDEVTKYEGKEFKFRNYFLVFDNGLEINIKPTFKKDYSVLKVASYPREK